MRLTRIEIENFKGIGTRQSLDLKPITLLFGPNSAGKSTVLQALHYAREILERQNANPDQTIAGGLIGFGGFANVIHNHDLSRTLTIKLVLELRDPQGNEHLPLNSGTFLNAPDLENLRIRYFVGENSDLLENAVVQEVGVALEIKWSALLNGAYVASVTTEMDRERIASIVSSPDEGRAQITNFNFNHRLLAEIAYDEEEAYLQALASSDNKSGVGDPYFSPLGSEVWELSRELANKDYIETSEFRIGVSTVSGALPPLDERLKLSLRDPDASIAELEEDTPRVYALAELLDELLVGPLRIAKDFLGAMTYIGPLREIPSRSFRPQISPREERWAQGLAAWDLLYSDKKGRLLQEVNDWLNDEERLRTNYRIVNAEYLEIPVSSRFDQLFRREITADDLGELQEEYRKLTARTEIVLRDTMKGVDVAPSDVGVGISQMIPVVVACLRDRDGILAVEQPELHIHPAIQVGMGDLFIHAVRPSEHSFGSGKALLVETHSEHIMLRLLRRIRETSDGELPPGALELSASDLSVIYVENTEDEVIFRPLRVDNDGDFKDRWPNGFFEERAEELF